MIQSLVHLHEGSMLSLQGLTRNFIRTLYLEEKWVLWQGRKRSKLNRWCLRNLNCGEISCKQQQHASAVCKTDIYCDMSAISRTEKSAKTAVVWEEHDNKGQVFSMRSAPRSLREGMHATIDELWKQLWSWASRDLAPRRTDWRETASRQAIMTLS